MIQGSSGLSSSRRVSVDLISLPETTSRSSDVTVDEILTVTDRATKMVVLIPCSSRCNAAEVDDNFWWEVVRYHGLPRSIISDRGPVFVSEFWTELMKFLDIDARRSSPYHPQANGQAERTNQTLKQVLRMLRMARVDCAGGDCDQLGAYCQHGV